MSQCAQCQTVFEFLPREKEIFQQFQVPEPTLCGQCRHRRRLSFRNEHHLHRRSCDMCKRQMVALYPQEVAFPVYCPECFWGDAWDPCEYGQEFVPGKSFFAQCAELFRRVPVLSNTVFNSPNSEYNSFTVDSRNIYYSARVGDSEDILYSYLIPHCERCVDSYNISYSQDCYECIDCTTLNNCFFCQMCRGGNDLWFCYDMVGCSECFGCIGLRNVQYHFFNEKLGRDEYARRVAEFLAGVSDLSGARRRFYEEQVYRRPLRAAVVMNSENSYGNHIIDSKDCGFSFDIEGSESVYDSWGVEYSKDVYYSDFIYYAERCYENISNSKSHSIRFSFAALGGCYDLEYCMLCMNSSHDALGCISLKHGEYCVLNRRYSKEEFQKLASQIREQMRQQGEYGEFFPAEMSLYPYHESAAMDYFPVERGEVREEPRDHAGGEGVLQCSSCARGYKIVQQEREFYEQKKLPVPHFCPHCRREERLTLRNPRWLWLRECAQCHLSVQTAYPPEKPVKVLCDTCYLQQIY